MKRKYYIAGILLLICLLFSGCGKKGEDVAIVEQRDFKLLKTVCLESMPLRNEPGFNSRIVETLYPQAELEWLGEIVEVGGTEFYHVRVLESGNEGYCSAKYCILVDYEYVEEALRYVESDDAVYSYEMMVEDLNILAKKYPDRFTISSLGNSAEGRKIYQAVLGNPSAETAVFIQAGIHGREYMCTQLVMKMLEYYTLYYHVGSYREIPYTQLFDNVCFYVIPMSNPDGISISQFGESAVKDETRREMLQQSYDREKKIGNYNTTAYEEYLIQWKANANGVDLNRNFNAQWEKIEGKTNPSSDAYKGNAPESEPETQVLIDAVRQRKFSYIVNYHARGQIIYYDVKGNSEEMANASYQLALLFQEQNQYEPVNCKDSSSVTLGGFGDWVMLSEQIPSITIEIGKNSCPLEILEFASIWIRNRETWGKLAWEIIEAKN